ncbi:MAG TPA: hypothetical protein PLH19_07005 [Anaerolineae bacterium]|nr:hypothetical protein [Anaerolineae bacterium]HQH38270.1 hypothetical protein [Anaerolineae bacterium]
MNFHTLPLPSLPRVLATAGYQARLLVRQPAFWLFQAILTLLLYVNVFQVLLPTASSADFVATIVGKGFSTIVFVLTAFLVAPAVARSCGPVADILWSTSLRPFEFAAGMFTGLYLPLACSVCIHLLLHWVATFLPGATAKTPPLTMLIAFGLPPLLTVLALAVAVYLLLAAFFRTPILVYVVALAYWVIWLAGLIVPTATLLSPWNIALLTYTLSPSAGLGADAPLVRGVLTFWGVLALTLVSGLPWGLVRAHRLDALRPALRAIVWPFAGLVVAGSVLLHFAAVASTAQVPATPGQPTGQWSVVQNDVHLHLHGAQVEGQAVLTLRNAGMLPVQEMFLRLNAGLEIKEVSIGGAPAAARREGDSVLVPLPLPVAPEESIVVSIHYGGRLFTAREDYARADTLRGPWIRLPLPLRAYLADGIGFLERDGDWHPWPLVAGPHLAEVDWRLAVRFSKDAGKVLAADSAQISTPDDAILVEWQGTLPSALLAYGAIQPCQVDQQVFLPAHATAEDCVLGADYLSTLTELRDWLGLPPTETWRVVALPYRQDAAWGEGVLFYPETSEYMASLRGLRSGELEPTRAALHRAHEVSLAWWRAQVRWPPPLLVQRPSNGITNNPQIPAGRLMPESEQTLDEALAWYTAIHVTAHLREDPTLVDQEISFWTRVFETNRGPLTPGLEAMLNRQQLDEELAARGISNITWTPPRLAALAADILSLHEVYLASPGEDFQALLREFGAKYSLDNVQPAAAESFFTLAREQTGQDHLSLWQARHQAIASIGTPP